MLNKQEVKTMENIGMLILSMIPAWVFIGAVTIMELIFDFVYDHSPQFKEWADKKIYESEESK